LIDRRPTHFRGRNRSGPRRRRHRVVLERVAEHRRRNGIAASGASAATTSPALAAGATGRVKHGTGRVFAATAASAEGPTSASAAAPTGAAATANAAMTPSATTQAATMQQSTAATAAAQVARNQAIEHPADPFDEANRMQWSTRPAGRVVAVGFDRHWITAGPVGHRHVVAPHRGASWPDDGVGRRIIAAKIRIRLREADRRQHETQR
jgi:hypothetical protein